VKVLIACEFSGIVRDAFIAKGHDAVSCDLLPTERPGPHFESNIEQIIQFSEASWDLMIAFPPCTYLCVAGLHYSKKSPERMKKTDIAVQFFKYLYAASIDRICIENPVGYMSTVFRKPDQIINPYNFGVPERKKTCLWLKGLPILEHTNTVEVKPIKTIIRKTGSKAGQPYNYYWRQGKSAKDRSRTFQCLADAMADQWG
jgi:hypothetical protein